MARLALPDVLTPEQAEVMAEAVAGKRGKVPAPMIGWLPNPELARRAQHDPTTRGHAPPQTIDTS